MGVWRYPGFGLELECDRPLLTAFAPDGVAGAQRVRASEADCEALSDRWSAHRVELLWETRFDGSPYRMFRHPDGSHDFVWEGRAEFHLDAGAERLQCGFARDSDLGARRLLFDTVLWSISLLRGYELLHASAVSYEGFSIAFVSGTGGGKTSLALELIRRGALLISDDVVALSYTGAGVAAHPGPPLMNVPLGDAMSVRVGQLLAIFDGEAWVSVEAAVRNPVALDAVYVLERGTHDRLELHRRGAMALLPHAFGFPDDRPRLGRQLEILGDLARDATVMHLGTSETTSAAQLGDLIDASMHALKQPALAAR